MRGVFGPETPTLLPAPGESPVVFGPVPVSLYVVEQLTYSQHAPVPRSQYAPVLTPPLGEGRAPVVRL